MSDKNIDKLEEFFKMKSEEKTFDYDHQAWKALEARLEKKRRRFVLWKFLTGVIALLIIGGISFYSLSRSNVPTETNHQEVVRESEITQGSESALDNNQLKIKKNASEAPSITQNINQNIESKLSSARVTSQAENKIKTSSDLLQSAHLKGSLSNVNNNYGLTHGRSSSTYALPPSDIGINSSTNYLKRLSESSQTLNSEIGNSNIQEESENMFSFLGKLQITALDVDSDINLNMKVIDIENQPISSGFGMSAIFASDWSSTSTIDFKNRDYKYGIGVNYTIGSKLKLYTGVLIVNDNYSSKGSDYKAPYAGYWTKSIAPERVRAECKMIEIPLGLAYYFKGHSRNGFNVNLATTSVYMLNEKYWYNYAVEDPDNRKGWEGTNSSQDYFSLLNIGIGYQHIISKNLSINISPYANIPIRGIGHGSVNLASAGIQLQMNFIPSSK